MINKVFGRLTVESFHDTDSKNNRIWLCRCECGETSLVSTASLNNGHTTSCGCFRREILLSHSQTKTHGLSKHPLYAVWQGMNNRCFNPNNDAYKYYGGREDGNAIRVVDEWSSDFVSFYDWAIANGYRPGLTIDRENNDGNYEPDNCRWVTQVEQAKNRRGKLRLDDNKKETIKKDNRSTRVIAEEYGMSQSTVWRIKQEG